MFGSMVLDIAIGLVFVYLLLSLVCSAAKELIEAGTRHRARDLEKGIQELLDGPGGAGPHPVPPGAAPGAAPAPLSAQLYAHGLIASLAKGDNKPSYMPASSFALALLDTLHPATAAGSSGASSPAALRATVEALGNQELRGSLLAIIDTSANATQVREKIEVWFNGAMDRVSGWYTQRAKKIVFALGVAIVLLLNVDSVRMVNALSHDAALRNSLVAAAEQIAKDPCVSGTDRSACKPAADQIAALTTQVEGLGLPMGWPDGWGKENVALWLVKKFFGLLLTALAISLGAPFWFDLLNKAINVRSAIKPKQ